MNNLEALELVNDAAMARLELAQTKQDLAQSRAALEATTIASNRMRAALFAALDALAPIDTVAVRRAREILREGLNE